MATLIHFNILSQFMIILPFNLTAATKVQLSNGTLGSSVQSVVNGKGKVHPRIGHEGLEGEWSSSCTLSLTLELDGVGG
jgi:hypothetical protein